jgi:putative two-component system response regulator
MTNSYELLIVDDVSENIKVAISILQRDDYNFSYALNGQQAIEILKTKRFDLILLDIMMPGIDGFQLCKIIKNSPTIQDTPIIFLTAKVDIESIAKGFELGAVDYVTKPFHPVELKSRVATHLELYKYRKELKNNNKKLSTEIVNVKQQMLTDLEIAQKEILYILSDIMESDSGETACHVRRVAKIAKELAVLEGNLSEKEITMIYLAAPLHDIGKLFIDNSILHKKDVLSDDEFKIMKEHPAHALSILKQSDRELIKVAKVIAYEHHENYDGTGYPRGLKGEDIHIYGRIVAIADVLDALTHKRSYKEAWSFEKAIGFVIDQSAKKFDPRLVSLFTDHLEIFKEIMEDPTCL